MSLLCLSNIKELSPDGVCFTKLGTILHLKSLLIGPCPAKVRLYLKVNGDRVRSNRQTIAFYWLGGSLTICLLFKKTSDFNSDHACNILALTGARIIYQLALYYMIPISIDCCCNYLRHPRGNNAVPARCISEWYVHCIYSRCVRGDISLGKNVFLIMSYIIVPVPRLKQKPKVVKDICNGL